MASHLDPIRMSIHEGLSQLIKEIRKQNPSFTKQQVIEKIYDLQPNWRKDEDHVVQTLVSILYDTKDAQE